ncbi:hypothetical protein L7F22_036406 [Adiantum nelumboides]|nr:hypothetical protein [Adiantum nelumboides]
MGEKTGDVELSTIRHDPSQKAEFEHKQQKRRRRRRCLACCGCCGIVLLLIVLVFVILAFTVFKPKKPQLHVDRITIEDFDSKINLNLPPSVSLNITLGLLVSVTNPNKASFRYNNSTASVFYRDVLVGTVPIPSGYMGAGATAQLSTSLKLFADRLLTDGRVYGDFIANSMPFATTTEIGGRVKFLNIFKHHVDTSTVCNATITPFDIKKVLDNFNCKYGIEL